MLKTLTKPRKRARMIGPADNGRRMSLDEFDQIEAQEGYHYELNKGVIEVSNIPHRRHAVQQSEIRDQLIGYKISNPGIVEMVGTPDSTKVLIQTEQSERHPDIAVYTTPMPDVDQIWSVWVPTIAIELVSESSAIRDYEDKPSEYLAFGISEYWIVDGFKKQMVVNTRFRGIWKQSVLKPTQRYTTRHLPGFKLDLKRVFGAAN